MHLPELALVGGGLGGLGRQLRVRVDVVQRQVAPHVAQVVAERVEQLADHQLGLAAVRALVVAVLDERHRRVSEPRTWSRSGSTSSAGRARRRCPRAGARARSGQPLDRRRNSAPATIASDRRGQHADLGLLELLALERDARDQQRDREADAGDAPPPASTGQLSGGCTRRAAAARRARTRDDADRLADHVAEEMPSVIGEVTASREQVAVDWMPVLASANSGTITKLVHGWSRYCSRSLGEIDEATPSWAERASSGVGCSRKAGELGDALQVGARRRVRGGDQARPPGRRSRGRCPTCRARPRRRRRARRPPGRATTRRERSADQHAEQPERRSASGTTRRSSV